MSKRCAPLISATMAGEGAEALGCDGRMWTVTRYTRNRRSHLRWWPKSVTPPSEQQLKISHFFNNPKSFTWNGGSTSVQESLDEIVPNRSSDLVVTQSQGMRQYQEDRYFANTWLNNGRRIYAIGILDGHGGDATSELMRRALPKELANFVHGLDLGDPSSEGKINAAIVRAFSNAHMNLFVSPDERKRHWHTGTTATVCMWQQGIGVMWCAYVGDSEASVLVGRSMATNITSEVHKIANIHDRESRRIKSLGGRIVENYLGVGRDDHHIAISRAIGDLESYKSDPMVQPPRIEQFLVSPIPYVSRIVFPVGSVFVLASDGLWDVVRHSELIDFARHVDFDLARFANDLRETAKARRSGDNVTIAVFQPK